MKDYFKRDALMNYYDPGVAREEIIHSRIRGDPISTVVEAELREYTAGIIDPLAEDFHIGRSALLARIIEDGVHAELVKRSVRLYADGKVSMWKAAMLAGVSFYEMMGEIRRQGVHPQYGVEDFEADVKTLRKLKSSI
jgi:predicted HTH domain antitoxin